MSFARPAAARRPRLVAALVALVVVPFSAGRCPAEQTRAGADALAGSGAAIAPRDAAFFFASLRLREQVDRIRRSNAFKALENLPAVRRGLDSLREQRDMPGSPLSMVETFMQLPENAQAVEVLRDMVATDTFLYGDPSCVTFVRLVGKLQRAQQAAAFLALPDGGADRPLGNDSARVPPVPGLVAAASLRQVAEMDEPLSSQELQQRALVEALVDNLDLLVVPDLVWGFRVANPEAARTQLKRIEVLLKLFAQTSPEFADAIARKPVAGGELLTITLDGGLVPWHDLQRELEQRMDDVEGIDELFEKLQSLDLVLALGVIGDRVIISLGDAIDHLGKLALPGSGREGLLALPQFAPLVAHKDKPLTGISYLSAALTAALAPTEDDLEPWLDGVTAAAERADLDEDAVAEARRWLGDAATAYGARLPEPGPWLSYAFLAAEGYEGYAWDWARNQRYDGGRRLDLLRHAGGSPLAVSVARFKADPELFPDLVAFVRDGLGFARDHLVPRADEDDREKFEAFDEHIVPLGARLAEIVGGKFLPALADGQLGFVLDAKGTTKRPHAALPASAEPLPLPAPTIVVPLADAKLFREGLSDLFALSDELVDAVRGMNPDAVPEGYRIPDPRRTKVEGGSVWSFPLVRSGVDEQVAPAIGIGERAAVFTLAPDQAARLLAEARLDTGAALADFDRPLCAAAALDVAGLVDALRPWVLYLTRYGCVQRREGRVEAEEELSAEDEDATAKEALANVAVVFEVLKTLRTAVSETETRDDAVVTHWRNQIRDLPAK